MKMQKTTLQGKFGRILVDLARPSIKRLFLRQFEDGFLSSNSLLSEHASGSSKWAQGGVSYILSREGKRFQSRYSREHESRIDEKTGAVFLSNIRPCTVDGESAPYTENWNLSIKESGELLWSVSRHFEQSLDVACHGGPALFFNVSPNTGRTEETSKHINPAGNGVCVNWWVKHEALNAETLDEYIGESPCPAYLPDTQATTMKDKDGWAIFKLYTSFPQDCDLRVKTSGGHLYRRGRYFDFNEIGLTAGPQAGYSFKTGEIVEMALELSPSRQLDYGQQLMYDLYTEDKPAQIRLQRFFSGLANSGCVADPYRHLLGNQTDGHLFAGNGWMHAYSLLATIPSDLALSSASTTYSDCFADYVQAIFDSVNERGYVELGFAYRNRGEMPELSMSAIVAAEANALHTGDVSLLESNRETIHQFQKYLQSWLKDGLFFTAEERIKEVGKEQGTNWYYDLVWGAHGFTMYHNAYYVRSLQALQNIYKALGEAEKAAACGAEEKSLIAAINEKFWDDNAFGPGQGGYYDWIRTDGGKRAYFFACNQYPAIVHGIASEDQARRIIATADARIDVLVKEHGYTREATLDCLWPLQNGDIKEKHLKFGSMENGGILGAMTFWEVTARCLAGDQDGAWELLTNFSKRAGKSNWYEGVNSFSINGQPIGWCAEPFLADQVVVPASVVFGIFGIRYSWDEFTITPHKPSHWTQMTVRIRYKNIPHFIRVEENGKIALA